MKVTRVLIFEADGSFFSQMTEAIKELHASDLSFESYSDRFPLNIEKYSPDVVLIDLNYSSINDPIETALEIKKIYDIPVIYLCDDIDFKAVQQFPIAAFDGLIQKPAAFPVVYSNINSAVYKNRIIEKLTERENKYVNLIEEINEVIFFVDDKGIVTYVSPTFKDLSGFSGEEVIGGKFTDFIHSDDLISLAERFEQLVRTGEKKYTQYRIKTSSGGYVWVRSFSHPVYADGVIAGIKGIMINITEQKEAELKLERSRSAISGILSSAPVGIGYFRDRRLEWINERISEITGYDIRELEGSDMALLFPDEENYKETVEKINSDLAGYGSASLEIEWRRKGGTMIEVLLSVSLAVEGSLLDGVIFSVLDITERKRSERILESQRNLGFSLNSVADIDSALNMILESVSSIEEVDGACIYLPDRQGGTFVLNTTSMPEELIYPEVETSLFEKSGLNITGDGPMYFSCPSAICESFFNCKEYEMMSAGIIPVLYEKRPAALLCVFSKLYDDFPARTRRAIESFASEIGAVIIRIKAEENLRRTNDELSAINEEFQATIEELEAMNDAFEQANDDLMKSRNELFESERKFRIFTENNNAPVFVVQDQKLVYVNRSFLNFLEYEHKEVLETDLKNFIYDDDIEMVIQRASARHRGEKVPTRYEIRMVSGTGDIKWVDLSVALIDYNGSPASLATLLDLSERKYAESRLLMLESAVDQAAEAVVIMDPDGVINYVNPAACGIYGLNEELMIGKNPLLRGPDFVDLGFDDPVFDVVSSGNVCRETVNLYESGDKHVQLESVISPVYGDEGAVKNYIAVSRDVTNESRLQRELQQAQKLEAVGTLVGGIAHDFNNIVAIIMGYTELSFYDISKKHPVYDNLLEILSAAQRAKDLIQQILTFSRQTEHEVKPVGLGSILKETIKFLRASLPATIEIRHEINTQNDLVLADPVQLHQILMNLCANAKQAMSETGGVLKIVINEENLKSGTSMNLEPGKYIVLEVSDSGTGISPEIINRIFDPFFTTKEQGEGTGLGLSVVHGIAAACGGAVRVESEPGSGSSFYVYFPYRLSKDNEVEEDDAVVPVIGSERIMVVDDEERIVQILSRLLKKLGYRVDPFTGSREALDFFEKNSDAIDLVITDQTMPDLTGLDLSKRIISKKPDIPVILCSGFSEIVDEKSSSEAGISMFMMKPLSIDELTKNIRVLLDSGN